jgi:hypothetical protein
MCAGNSAYHLSISLRNYWKSLRVRAVQNLGLQDSAINPGICQMFPNAKHGESGKPKPIPQFFEGQCFQRLSTTKNFKYAGIGLEGVEWPITQSLNP